MHLERMVEALVFVYAVQRPQGAGLRIRRTVNAAPDACLMHQPRAHYARFQRDVHRAMLKPPGIELPCGLEHGDELRMACGVLLALALVSRTRDDLRLGKRPPRARVDGLVHDDGADRHFVGFGSLACLLDGQAHVRFVIHADIIG